MFDLSSTRAKVIFWGVFALFIVFIFFPLLWMVVTALKTKAEIFRTVPTLIPLEPTFDNIRRALFETNLPVYLRNSLITAGGSAVLTTLLAALAAYGFAKYRYFGRKPLMIFMIAAQMFPFTVLLISIYPMLVSLGLLNTHLGLIIAYIVFALPAGTYMMYSFFVHIPTDLIEAARMDGASEVKIIGEVILPLSVPGLITVGLYSFMWAWNDLLYSLTLLTSDDMRTVGPGLLLSFFGEMQQDWGGAMASSLIASLPVIIGFAFLQRYFIQGVTAGAVKT